tara:strand:+ start:216 stop:365 length:150 start_codon:yes stop_codon:yes gene_type:complete
MAVVVVLIIRTVKTTENYARRRVSPCKLIASRLPVICPDFLLQKLGENF